jgi:hypothetical protein
VAVKAIFDWRFLIFEAEELTEQSWGFEILDWLVRKHRLKN